MNQSDTRVYLKQDYISTDRRKPSLQKCYKSVNVLAHTRYSC